MSREIQVWWPGSAGICIYGGRPGAKTVALGRKFRDFQTSYTYRSFYILRYLTAIATICTVISPVLRLDKELVNRRFKLIVYLLSKYYNSVKAKPTIAKYLIVAIFNTRRLIYR